MKYLFTLSFIAFISMIAYSQPPKYDDLKILYADANYEKLAKVAANYTEKDKTKKHVLPYIWLSKGLYKVSLSGTSNEKFKNAYKDAIKYLGKGIKYDLKYNDGVTIQEHQEFVDEFQLSLLEIIENEVSSGSFKRAYGWTIKYKKISQNVAGIQFMMGACKFEDQDKPSARTFWQDGTKAMNEITSIDNYSEADRGMLKSGILYSAEAMYKGRQSDKARALLNKAAQWFEEDEDWKERYDEIVN